MRSQSRSVIKQCPASTCTRLTAEAILLLLLLLVPSSTRAHPGDLDSTFGVGGKVLLHVILGGGEFNCGVLIQSDGKILLGDQSNYGDAAGRFNTNGVLDDTFGSGGTFYQFTHGFPQTMALVADDKFIMAGGSYLSGNTKEYFYMRRYNSNGSVDSTFGSGGAVATDVGDGSYAVDAAIQKDGKIVLGGESLHGTNWDFTIVRYNADGSLDPSFGNGGVVTTYLGKQRNYCYRVAIQPDGKILAGGSSENSGDDANFAVVRYLTNGVLDPSFNGTGKVVSYFGIDSEAFGLAVQNDDKILLGGWVNEQFALARYNTNGTLDTSFGADHTGLVTQRIGYWDSWNTVAVQPDGKILAAGGGSMMYIINAVVARYDPDGRPDSTFGANGLAIFSLGSANSGADSLALQPDGKLLVSGTTWDGNNYSDVALARLENNIVAPPTVVCPGQAIVECGRPIEITAVAHNPSGLPLTVVWSINGAFAQTNDLPATNGPVDVGVSFTVELPLGTNTVSVSVTDSLGQGDACSTSVIVVDSTAPLILSAEATPDTLWPPNHQMVPVEVSASVFDQCGPVTWKIVKVLSNEPVDGQGDGKTEPDWIVTGDHTLLLRSERSGAGSGRVYSIVIQASDSSGNLSRPRIVNVTVPKSTKNLHRL